MYTALEWRAQGHMLQVIYLLCFHEVLPRAVYIFNASPVTDGANRADSIYHKIRLQRRQILHKGRNARIRHALHEGIEGLNECPLERHGELHRMW